MNVKKSKYNFIYYLPIIGVLIFTVLYVYASFLYPGGSQADINHQGFDWINNYWCDLMGKEARNEVSNPAYPFAIAATVVLGVSLAFFFYLLPIFIPINRFWNMGIRISGMTAMCFGILIFTPLHDVVIISSTLLSLVAIIGLFVGLFKHQFIIFIGAGVLCITLLIMNNYMYFITNQVTYLPFIQKITFAVVLIWIVSLQLKFIQITQ